MYLDFGSFGCCSDHSGRYMKKLFYIILAIIIIAGGYYFYDNTNKQAKAPNLTEKTEESSNNSQQTLDNTSTTPTPTPSQASKKQAETIVEGTFSSGESTGGEGSDVQVHEIVYDGSKFTPSRLEIKVNDYVFFKNESSVDFWPASASHPNHDEYPEFDAKKAIAPGKTFKFQFTKAGNWGFHDHLNPDAIGLIEVK